MCIVKIAQAFCTKFGVKQIQLFDIQLYPLDRRTNI